MAEIIAVPSPYPTVSVDSRDARIAIGQQMSAMHGRSLPLVSMVIEPPAGYRAQKQAFGREVRTMGRTPGIADAADADLLQARLSTLRSCMYGAKGIVFRTTRPLDTADELGRARCLQAINAELELLRPWLVSPTAAGRSATISDPSWQSATYTTDRSTLVLMTTAGEGDRIAAVAPQPSVDLVLPRGASTQRAYRITHGGITSLQLAPRTDGWGVHLESPAIVESIVLTDDANVVRYLRNALPRYAAAALPYRIESADQQFAVLQDSLNQEQIPAGDNRWQAVPRIASLLRESTMHQSRGDLDNALRAADAALTESTASLRISWVSARSEFADPRSNPLLCNLLSLAEHQQLVRLTAGRRWQSHPLPSGDFESIDQFISTGWTHDVRHVENTSHDLAVVADAGVDQGPALRLAARSVDGTVLPGGFAGSTMRVTSPIIQVPPARLVRIAGNVRIDSPSAQPDTGVVFYDSLATSALGQPILAGPTVGSGWREFELFRISDASLPLQLYIELRGEVTAVVDKITVDSITINPNGNFVTTPLLENRGQENNR